MIEVLKKETIILQQTPFFEVREAQNNKFKGLISRTSYRKFDTICPFTYSGVVSKPDYLTVQINEEEHIYLSPEYLLCINHSCQPNVFFDVDNWNLLCIQDIEPGDELCFFYPSTEWEMAESFDCQCGSPRCLKKIKGASLISQHILKNYRLSSFILKKAGLAHD
ncbi:MAG: SET domain-containing protein-lysine N-methyltransferase [Bacteroidota bacterium]|nr:SET domain-containing protein-lysine N-methyltransferase [Bacteroidota bacterium]